MLPEALRYSQRRRSVSPGAPDRIYLSPGYPHHAVVGAHVYGSVVDQEVVGDDPDLLKGLLVSVGYGLVGVVAAGHHERYPGVVQEQMVQRGVGQHYD